MTRLDEQTQEGQYRRLLEVRDRYGVAKLGLMANQSWHDDPRRLVFMLARYKFVSKMLSGLENVLEVGCGDAFASRIVMQEVGRLSITDFDPIFVADAEDRQVEGWQFADRFVHDLLAAPISGDYDAIYALDVLEHIRREDESLFLKNLLAGLGPHGTLIIGMPTLESQAYASLLSREGHVNCKSSPDLSAVMRNYFHNVFMFSMNDEVVHTGYHKMAHYIFSLCCGKR